jgi:predicted  nucleic acid-binding Zn-ribbon protein
MKRLVFEEIQVLSFREKKAIKVQFNPKRTIIKGSNQVGKSSLMKSIYYTLGANPSVINDNWLKAEPITYLKFKVDEKRLSVMRYNKIVFVVIDENGITQAHNFKSLSAYLNKIFDFNLIINNRKGEAETPPPAYLFLPFYIDQDKSWNDNWNSFANLSQFSKWKKPLLDYHSGIKGNSYYKTKSEFDSIKTEIEETKNEIDTLNKILRSIKSKLKDEDFNISVDDFSNEVTELLSECEILKVEQNKLKHKLTEFYNQKSVLLSRISIVETSINESKLDYKYALNYIENEIDCPMCGAHYENNFSERFSIAEDEENLDELLKELKNELLNINEEIQKFDKSFIDKKIDFEKIQELLNEKKAEIKLIDLIENEGKKRVKEIFVQEQNEIYTKIGKATTKFSSLEIDLKRINKDGETKKQNIMNLYRSKLTAYLKNLNIDTEKTSKGIFERMDSNIKEQGSNLPRALLAYYFAFLHIMDKYSTSTFCPIVIDSPNQQEQDSENLKAIMNFINQNQPENSQLILSLVEDIETTFDKDTLYLENEKYSLLKADFYDEVYNELSPIIEGGIFNDELPF